jgi:hypothetical protein
MNKYLEILNLFVSNDDLRPAMTAPNKGVEFTSATDAHSIIYFPNDLLPKDTAFEDKGGKYPDVMPYIKVEDNCNNLLRLENIKSVLLKCPLIEDFDEEEKENTCDECDGSGEVTFTYEDGKLKDHEMEGECPICDGQGNCVQTVEKPNGKMIYDSQYHLNIDDCKMSIFLIERLMKVAEILDSKIFIVNKTDANKAVTFKVGQVKVMLMPIMRDDNSKYGLGNIA